MKYINLYIAFFIALLSSCSASKFISENEYLLDKVELKSTEKGFDAAVLGPYIKQKANSKWFSIFKIPLATYSLAGKDTAKWINRTLRNIGEEPVIYDVNQAHQSQSDLLAAMHNMGYMHASVQLDTRTKGKKITATYTITPGQAYFIDNVHYIIDDDSIANLLKIEQPNSKFHITKGTKFSVDKLDNIRKRISDYLLNSGFYRFNKDFIQFTVDSAANSQLLDVTMHLYPYRAYNDAPAVFHPRYKVGRIDYHTDNANGYLRRKIMLNNTALVQNDFFSEQKLQRTYNNFAKLGAVRYTNIQFEEVPDSQVLNTLIELTMNKPSSVSFQPEGTNTAGDLGAAVSLTYTNKNLFHGSELLSIELRGAYEAIKGLEGYNDQNYKEYGIETRLAFPRFVAPFLSHSFTRNSQATSELSLSWNLQNRPEFHRRVFSAAWRYRWEEAHHNLSYRFDLLDLNYVSMPWISETFKRDYLDDEGNRNAILRYNYEDLFIMKLGFGLSYNDGSDAVRANVESSGNLLNSLSHIAKFKTNSNGQNTLFGIAYAQYAKMDVDYTHLFKFDEHNTLAAHIGFGIAYPYGNSKILPFEKRYFSGGANSVRGWTVRGLGPGKFKGKDGRIDFINQTGDMKLDFNLEYRTHMFWKLDGAVFVDAGNIWTLKEYADQPGGEFTFNEFYKQIAVAYGVGLRLNFDYFILRMDMGMKAINPAYESKAEHYALVHPNFSRDFAFHFAVGLPF